MSLTKRKRAAHEDEKLQKLTPEQSALVLKLEEQFATTPYYNHLHDDCALHLDTHCFVRFLAARKWSYPDALKFMNDWIAWREKVKPRNYLTQHVHRELKKRKAYWHGFDKNGYPIVICRPQHHYLNDRDVTEVLQFCYYTAETGISMMDEKSDRYVILYDARSLSVKNMDLAIVKEFLTFSYMYPERLKHLIVYKPGVMYTTMLALVKPFLDAATSEKIIVATKDDDLHELVDKVHLEPEFGGTSSFVFNVDEYGKFADALVSAKRQKHHLCLDAEQISAEELELD